jgi:hypothetical protein
MRKGAVICHGMYRSQIAYCLVHCSGLLSVTGQKKLSGVAKAFISGVKSFDNQNIPPRFFFFF